LYVKIILTAFMIHSPIVKGVLHISAAIFLLVMNKITSLLIDRIPSFQIFDYTVKTTNNPNSKLR